MRDGGVNNMKNYKIAVAGTGYVGLSIATLLSQHHQVTAVDIVPEKVELINNRKSPIQDDYIEKYLAEKELNLTAILDAKTACINKVTIASGVLIAGNVLIEDHFHGDVSSSEADIEPNKRILKSRGEISIGENVWIGENVVIMPGVSIGRGCVIGANSTVTKSIPDYAVAAGSPAKIIRRLKN